MSNGTSHDNLNGDDYIEKDDLERATMSSSVVHLQMSVR